MIITQKHKETEILFLVEEAEEGGYIARSFHHSIYTQADTLDELREMVLDAVACHFDDDDTPNLIRLHIVKDEVIAV
ncbi:MAG: 2-oxoisovalerate dehydrogenase [Methanomicrobiales archaeon]|jgi:predicted RNase H-like HicB family nuclease|nr:2-oxoisovalerate dehydrogenase [Methanomicrobiales archaeon]